MSILNLSRKELIPKDWLDREAKESHCSIEVDHDAEVFDESGNHLISYVHSIEGDSIESMRSALFSIGYQKSTRTNGLVTNSRIFGYAPRNTTRNHICRESSLASDSPKEHRLITNAASVIESYYRKLTPEEYRRHSTDGVAEIDSEWRIGETVFTSGIANKNNAINYHYDRGNVLGCRSAMITFHEGMKGGRLCIPELDLRFNLGNKSLLLFDGQSLIHGVTPIFRKPNGYRITTVFYTLREMWRCETSELEIERERNRRWKLEKGRSRTEGNSDD